jgi:hypothetical protein
LSFQSAAGLERIRPPRAFNALIKADDLPRPIINGCVNGSEVDAHWPRHRLIVEVDDFEHFGTRAAFEADRARDAEPRAAGWRVLRITFLMLGHRAAQVAARLRRLLALQAASPKPSGSRLASISPGVSPA